MHPVTRPEESRLSASLAYDAIAAEYDEHVRGDDWMRQALHAHYLRLFRTGDRVLDVGCGTGIDAIALARAGIRVLGIDGAPAVIERLRSKRSTAGVEDLVDARILTIQELDQLRDQPFDGLISAFASLSSLPDLAQFADDAAHLVRPGGHLVLHMLNRFSLWEWLGYVSRRDWTAARRVGRLRKRQFSIGGVRVEHSLYFGDEAYRLFFEGKFTLRARYSLGALRPPHTVRRIPRAIVAALEWLDVRTGAWPLLENAGRFFVLDLERLPA
jgi:SAM-dependent methyltransferase